MIVKMNIPSVSLQNKESMPLLGLGTWQLTGSQCEKAVKMALDLGYPHIDTSDDYRNEERIGNAIKGYDRSQLFITSKVDDSKLQKNDVIKAGHDSLERLGVDYLDLYLIHRPNPKIPISETMMGMKELIDQGLVRSIGISNFSIQQTKEATNSTEIPVCVNQIKINPYHYPIDDIQFLKEQDIVVTAYSPLGHGGLVNDDFLSDIGKKYDKSASQISLRWLLDQNLIVIPKASTKDHLEEDIDIFDWDLKEEDVKAIAEKSGHTLERLKYSVKKHI